MYLLNEKNYEKDLNDFKEGFNKCYLTEPKIEGELFQEFNDILKMDNFYELAKNITIRCNEDSDTNIFTDTYIDDSENVNDVLGFIREPLKLY